jgi:hypothetical protein
MQEEEGESKRARGRQAQGHASQQFRCRPAWMGLMEPTLASTRVANHLFSWGPGLAQGCFGKWHLQ